MASVASAAVAASTQDIIDSFWKANLASTKPPDRPFSVLPDNVYAKLQRQRTPEQPSGAVSVTTSYDNAVRDCEAKVAQIVAECRRNNVKYSDPHFNLDNIAHCSFSLALGIQNDAFDPEADNASEVPRIVFPRGESPPCAKRVGAIFEKPQFYIGGPPDVRDLRQGNTGDCWFLASVVSLCGDATAPLVEKLCPPKARDEKVGVYGFVFYRDGEWISEVIDDKLYLSSADYDHCNDIVRDLWDATHHKMDKSSTRKAFRREYQTGSNALYHSSCSDPNETWVPLLEKAFAKAHGDYEATEGGFAGEGLEDLTGGVSTRLTTSDILDPEELWNEGLMHVNETFLFGAGSKHIADAEDEPPRDSEGVVGLHAYSVLRAVEYEGTRLLLIKNPWGSGEWEGAWSDGSKEWTPEAMKFLDYQFGNDGLFWMSYEDFLERFRAIDRTRLFTPNWTVAQKWTTVDVPWSGDYNTTRFRFSIAETTKTVISLSKLDNRYFKGLTGRYIFDLGFRLHQTGEEIHLIRGYTSGNRSATAELDLEAGSYDVLLHISADRDNSEPRLEDVVKNNWMAQKEKLIQVGLSYDLAHAKGQNAIAASGSPQAALPIGNPRPVAQGGKTQAQFNRPDHPVDGYHPQQAWHNQRDHGYDYATHAREQPEDLSQAGSDGPWQDVDSQNPDGQSAPPSIDGDGPAPGVDEFEAPWNATLVVGLRVFCEQSSAEIAVITPHTEAEIEIAKEDVKLDIDSAEKDLAESPRFENPQGGGRGGGNAWRGGGRGNAEGGRGGGRGRGGRGGGNGGGGWRGRGRGRGHHD